MKINSIIIENFKGIGYEKAEMGGKISALIGPNGIGKTSFLEAVRYGLTGCAPQNPVKDGEESATVTITLDDGTTFSRTIFADERSSRVMVNDRVTPAKNLNTLIEEKFGFGTDVLKIATSAEIVASMKSDELGDFLLRYIPEKLNVTKILGYVSDLTEGMQEKILSTFPDGTFNIEDVGKVYEIFAEDRKNAKKELAYTREKMARASLLKPEKDIDVLQAEYDDILKAEGAFKSQREAASLYDAVKAKRDAAIENMNSLQKRVDAITASRPNPIIREKAMEKLGALQAKEKDVIKMLSIMHSTVDSLNNTLKSLSSDRCPLSNALVCTTDKTLIKGEIISTIKSNEEGIAIQEKIAEDLNKQTASVLTEIREYDMNEKAYSEKILLGEQLLKAKKSMPELPAKISLPPDRDFEKEKAAKKGEILLAKEWNEGAKLEERERKEAAKLVTLESLCKSFAPKGEVMTKIISSYTSIFESEINKRATALRVGLRVKFAAQNGVKYLVKMKEEKGFRQYNELSTGEKVVAIFLLLDLISSLCGTKILLIDNMNDLDAASLNEVFKLLTNEEFAGHYDNIVVAAVDTNEMLDIAKKYTASIHML